MRTSLLLGFLSLLLLIGLAFSKARVYAQNQTPTTVPMVENHGDARRVVNSAAPNTITSLPMSNPFCFQQDPSVNQCSLNIRYWQANDNGIGNILAYVLFSVDGKLRYRSNAFFENFITYSFDMIPGGIELPCGLPNEGGYGALYGKGYAIDIRAFDVTDTWVLDDQLVTKCPAFNP